MGCYDEFTIKSILWPSFIFVIKMLHQLKQFSVNGEHLLLEKVNWLELEAVLDP